MKLSELTDKTESVWNSKEYNNATKFMNKINELLEEDLTSKSPYKDPLDTYEYYKVWLLNYYTDEFMESLDSIDVSFEHIKRGLIHSFILSVSRSANNIEVLTKVFIDKCLFKSFKEKDGWYIIETDEGEIKFTTFYDKAEPDIQAYMDSLGESIEELCHMVSLEMIKEYPSLKSVTSICNRGLNQKYYHSFNVDEEGFVIDLTGNIIMKKDDYYKLLEVNALNTLDYNSFLKESKESVSHDESGTLEPLLRCALYKESSKGKSMK